MSKAPRFRVWFDITRIMEEFSISDIYDDGFDDGVYGDNDGSVYLREDAKIMQFTGLHDKKGKPVFEGDIIRYIYNTHKPDDIEFYSMNPIVGEVMYSNMLAHYSVNGHRFMRDISEPEVIGNIYETPGLLEGK